MITDDIERKAIAIKGVKNGRMALIENNNVGSYAPIYQVR
jgi:hypothetical protein